MKIFRQHRCNIAIQESGMWLSAMPQFAKFNWMITKIPQLISILLLLLHFAIAMPPKRHLQSPEQSPPSKSILRMLRSHLCSPIFGFEGPSPDEEENQYFEDYESLYTPESPGSLFDDSVLLESQSLLLPVPTSPVSTASDATPHNVTPQNATPKKSVSFSDDLEFIPPRSYPPRSRTVKFQRRSDAKDPAKRARPESTPRRRRLLFDDVAEEPADSGLKSRFADYDSELKEWEYGHHKFTDFMSAFIYVRNVKMDVMDDELKYGLKNPVHADFHGINDSGGNYRYPDGGMKLISSFNGVRFSDSELSWEAYYVDGRTHAEITIGYFQESFSAAVAYNKFVERLPRGSKSAQPLLNEIDGAVLSRVDMPHIRNVVDKAIANMSL